MTSPRLIATLSVMLGGWNVSFVPSWTPWTWTTWRPSCGVPGRPAGVRGTVTAYSLPSASAGNTVSSRWSQASTVSGTMAHGSPVITWTGSDDVTVEPAQD